MATKSRELGWSLSKARMFEECPRRYYYSNYFSKSGYAYDAPDEAKLALEMRSIKGLDMWVGEIVHATIQWILEQVKDGVLPTADAAKAEVRRRLSGEWRASALQLWRNQSDDLNPNLFEHYYRMPVSKTTTDRLMNKAFACIGNFMASDILKKITMTPSDRWLPIEKYSSFRMDGLLFYIKFDFALRSGEYLCVYDWKTGKPTEDEVRQLACYALYTSDKWKVPIENIRVCGVHLQPTLDAEERPVDEADIDSARAFAHQSFNAMVRCLQNPARNLAAMDGFPMTGNLLRCTRCQFRGICIQGKQASGDIEDLPVVEDWNG